MENDLLPITFKFSSEVLIHLYNYFNAGDTHRIETSTRNVTQESSFELESKQLKSQINYEV